MGRLRKRYLVTEGDLFQLYAEIKEVRNKERRTTFKSAFKKLLQESQEISLTVKKKGDCNES